MYTFLDFIGDIGGVIDILIASFGYIFYKLSQFSFNLKFFEKLFLARSKQNKLFKIESLKKKNSNKNKFKTIKHYSFERKETISNIEHYFPIKLSFKLKIRLFLLLHLRFLSRLLYNRNSN